MIKDDLMGEDVWITFYVKDGIIYFPSKLSRTYWTQDEALQDKDILDNFYEIFQALSCSKAVKLLPLEEYLELDGGILWKM